VYERKVVTGSEIFRRVLYSTTRMTLQLKSNLFWSDVLCRPCWSAWHSLRAHYIPSKHRELFTVRHGL